MSKIDNTANELAEAVARRKMIDAEIAEISTKFADQIDAAEEALAKIKAKVAKAAEPLVEAKARIVETETNCRSYLSEHAPIGASWQTLHGTVSVQPVPTYSVTRFSSVPNEFRLPPEKCLNMRAVKQAFKEGTKVTGVRKEDKPSVVVR